MKLSEFFPSEETSYDKRTGKTLSRKIPAEKNVQQVLSDILYNTLGIQQQQPVDPILSLSPMPKATPKPTVAPMPNIEEIMRQQLTRYGGEDLPGLQYVPQMAQAAEQYPMFKANPYLLPQIMIQETSGGRNITRPNNLLNWGINYPGNNALFATMTPEQVLAKAISGLGERSPYYEKFRHGSQLTEPELIDFAKTYVEPTAGEWYGKNLYSGMQQFK